MTQLSANHADSESAKAAHQREDDERERLRAKWLTRLAVLALMGLVVVVTYALQAQHWATGRLVSVAMLGLMVAGASWVSGALTGFLFGIPHARDGVPTSREGKVGDAGDDSRGEAEEARYKPSTSLEQIADWLTKIIVGVGLTQLNNIPRKLDAIAGYVAVGMGSESANKPFALAVVVYFSVSGFLFGFLWSRLYMLRAFVEAEVLRRLEEIKGQLDFDNEATNLVSRQLRLDAPAVSQITLSKAIAKASGTTRDAIFVKAREARRAPGATDELKIRASEVFRALVSNDPDNLDHESHYHLGSILQDLGKPEESVKELTLAIEIRDRRGKGGPSIYDFKRAVGRITLDIDRPSQPDVRDTILADLKRARRDPKLGEDWERKRTDIRNWLTKNDLDDSNLVDP